MSLVERLGEAFEEVGAALKGSIPRSSGITVVEHGSNASTPRPAGAKIVWWIGSAAPSNAAINDVRVVT